MHTYEIVIVGSGTGRTITGWGSAQREARLGAARTGHAVELWAWRYRHTVRELKLTVFPDGSVVHATPLHRTRRGFGL